LELANSEAAGRGAIHFVSTSGEVEYAAGPHLANRISGFRGKDRIDFAQVSFVPGDHAVDKAGTVSLKSSAGVTVATFKVSGTYTSANFHVGKDASGHILVTYAATAAASDSSGAVANAAMDQVGVASAADLLGESGSQFPPPAMETQSGVVALDPLLPSVLAAEVYTGSLADHNGGGAGGARGALGVGEHSSVGHGLWAGS
jgi:hypothetical protein